MVMELDEDTNEHSAPSQASFFEEEEQFRTKQNALLQATLGEQEAAETLESMLLILQKYQEQPHLLDKHLETIISPLINQIRTTAFAAALSSSTEWDTPYFHRLMHLLYHLSKVRGHKIIVKFFSHEVADLEPLLALLQLQPRNCLEKWQARYVLLLWLSIVCMIPFNFRTIDSSGTQDGLVLKLLSEAKTYLSVFSKEREAAAVLLARLLIRRDILNPHLANFIRWSQNQFQSASPTLAAGILQTLAVTLKLGQRHDLAANVGELLMTLIINEPSLIALSEKHASIRKFRVKVAQRVGLVFLKPRLAPWRYQRGQRSLLENLNPSKSDKTSPPSSNTKDDADTDEVSVPDGFEGVIDLVLNALSDKDTIVRWSAAKGLGRLAEPLPQALAADIIQAVQSNISSTFSDPNVWHGGCLALAEFARRGLLLPQDLPVVFSLLQKALQFDEKQGSLIIGANVRDAACYVCWAFARAYDPVVMSAYLSDLAKSLVLVCLFDREIHCRRAASAAFQEAVGRHGAFPYGIDIVTAADYFAVGNRAVAFADISLIIARLEPYQHCILDHLAKVKAVHWDQNIRTLAAIALGRLAVLDRRYSFESVIKLLIAMAGQADIARRHGALLALGRVLWALSYPDDQAAAWKRLLTTISSSSYEDETSIASVTGVQPPHSQLPITFPDQISRMELTKALSVTAVETIAQTPLELAQKKAFQGPGSEILREANAVFVAHIALAQLPIHNDKILVEGLNNLLVTHIWMADETDGTLPSLLSALSCFIAEYYVSSRAADWAQQQISEITTKHISVMTVQAISPSQNNQLLAAPLVLGALPYACAHTATAKQVWHAFKYVLSSSANAVEQRRNAMEGLRRWLDGWWQAKQSYTWTEQITQELFVDIINQLLFGLDDYTTDHRGDVGSWVRCAAINVLQRLLCTFGLLQGEDSEVLFSRLLARRVIPRLLEQAASRIDRVRICAGEALLRLLRHDPPFMQLPARERLLHEFTKNTINWNNPAEVFPKLATFLQLKDFAGDVIVGMAASIGGLTESLVRSASNSLLQILDQFPITPFDLQEDNQEFISLSQFIQLILDQLQRFKRFERVSGPLLITLELILRERILSKLPISDQERFAMLAIQITKDEVYRSSDIRRLESAILIYCDLLELSKPIRSHALHQLLLLICYPYPKVRRSTAEQLYLCVTTDNLVEGDNAEANQQEVESILTETAWDNSVNTIKPQRDRLYHLFGLTKPVLVTTKQ